ncbi:hypothetical protein [Lichenicoccus sp.]|uniref:hypothetical protein n=1 Tax=Lichenicoccus sp. TaxID=2781899 RepID=UPI003D125D8C
MNALLTLTCGQLRRRGAQDGCITCGLTIVSALTWAHVHPGQGEDARRVFRLCWTCHRLYDHGLVETHELLVAEEAWCVGSRPEPAPWFRLLAAEMNARQRIVRTELQHKVAAVRAGLTIRRRNAALKAAATRRRNVAAAAEL